ncbi:MAG: bacillithiol system redox-active protein YtxJ [Cyclobacteriaceae bacterium]|nr:bacillithiol system redox-active protein YtxJ [Cyclobacteriaceae bacterium]MCK5372114.1 bacillithiol system redox-active protein YtxJ [Cyclobacteriaceae bacterium]MCK5468040.1 bacillithiol system redox-active protein YtxJ [Cyclobacteriaceae bacterium]MCK5699934.1 bacillithiol system redox-active protein YtxJ [Cyclobacteriaceae bacterium]
MNWSRIDSEEALSEMINKSFDAPQVLFKHSSRCSISSLALNKMQIVSKNIDLYILDIIAHRDISNTVAQRFNVIHQSPQLLMIHHGKCIYNTSHLGISASVVERQFGLLQ